MALLARLGEKEVIAAMARDAVAQLLAMLEGLEGRDEAKTGGSVWWRFLRDEVDQVRAQQSAVVARFQLLHSARLGSRATTAATIARAALLIFLWLHDRLQDPGRGELDSQIAQGLWAAWAQEAQAAACPGALGLLFEKLAFWGSYLLAQFA